MDDDDSAADEVAVDDSVDQEEVDLYHDDLRR